MKDEMPPQLSRSKTNIITALIDRAIVDVKDYDEVTIFSIASCLFEEDIFEFEEEGYEECIGEILKELNEIKNLLSKSKDTFDGCMII